MTPAVPGWSCDGTFDGASHACASCHPRHAGGPKECMHLVAESAAMRDVLRRASTIAASSAPVVIRGETGTGKELLARFIHAHGTRGEGPFVAVNCGAIHAELMESELFGHARGAFSGAIQDHHGLFEEASGGTLLLDEIAEIPLALQVKLLRVLQEGEVRRVGTNRPVSVDVRVLAATHRDLERLVREGAFREDLYYRLKVFVLRLAPLRERPEDVIPLARQVLGRLLGTEVQICPKAAAALLAHAWPGNARELVNAMRHAAALAQGGTIAIQDLPEEIGASASEAHGPAPRAEHPPPSPAPPGPLEPLAVVERRHILAVVAACRGNQAQAARALGIARNTLWRKLEAYALERDRAPAGGTDPPRSTSGANER
jgi:DNA-binding NtrC family response regulator